MREDVEFFEFSLGRDKRAGIEIANHASHRDTRLAADC